MKAGSGNYIANSLEQSIKELDNCLSRVVSNPSKKNIHRVRVTIKKLNATYRLLEFIFPANFNRNKYYNKVKGLFQGLGELRDLQLNNSYIKSCHLPAASQKLYSKFYMAKKDKATKKQRKALEEFDKNSLNKSLKAVYKLSRNLDGRNLLLETKLFIIKEAKEIKTLLKEYDDPGKIHEIRKLLKALNYNTVPLKAAHHINLLAPRLKETEKLIGAWHDRARLIQFVNKFIAKNHNPMLSNMEPFQKIIKRLSRENANTLNQLKPKIEDIMLTLSLI